MPQIPSGFHADSKWICGSATCNAVDRAFDPGFTSLTSYAWHRKHENISQPTKRSSREPLAGGRMAVLEARGFRTRPRNKIHSRTDLIAGGLIDATDEISSHAGDMNLFKPILYA